VLDLLTATDRPWAITRRAIRALMHAAQNPDFQAVAARAGQPVANANGAVENYNGTAVVDLRGPLFRYRSIWTWLLGGTSVEEAAIGLHAALDDSAVRAIVLAINSPGGQIDGINELANMIRAANAVKPVTAYVDGLAGSGAYWLASAAGRIVADETAQLGSIGVLATVLDDRGAEERHGVKRYEIISSQSPLKRTDPATDEGRAQLQQMVDTMAQVFIDKVAQFRGTTAARVERDFGRGAVLPAAAAVAAGMADALGSLEALLNPQMPMQGMPMDGPMRRIKDMPGQRVQMMPMDEEQMEDPELNDDSTCTCPPGTETCECGAAEDEDESEGTEQEPDDSSVPKGEGDLIKPTDERQRIAAILTCEEARGREELARVLALETNHTLEAAQKILKASPTASPANPLEARMTQIANPRVGVPGDAGEDDSPQAEAQRVLSFLPKHFRRQPVQ
jgi:signal peptide peptidase SppA